MTLKNVQFTLRVEIPDTIDADTVMEIAEGAEPDDRPDDALLRFLGSYLGGIEEKFSNELPEGWYARISGGRIQEPRPL